MTISYRDAVAFLCAKAGWSLTNLQIQKILYMADMNFVGQGKGRLISEDFEAWDYGPVLPSLYRDCKPFGSKAVPNVFWGASDLNGTQEGAILSLAWDMLKGKSAGELVETTHWQNGAWAKRYVPGVKCIKISTQDMINEYNARRSAKSAA
jgi:uncharacterized phage-associated protein